MLKHRRRETGGKLEMEVLDLKKRSRLYALLLTLAVVLAAAPAMGTVVWVQAPGGSYGTGILTPSVIITGTAWEDGISSGDIKAAHRANVVNATDDTTDAIRVQASVVNAYLGQKGYSYTSKTQMPGLFKIVKAVGSVDTVSNCVAVAHVLGNQFIGKKPEDIEVVKVKGPSSFFPFTRWTSKTLGDKRFVIVSGDQVVDDGTALVAGNVYHIVISFKISGDFDLGVANCVVDPVFFVAPTGGTPSPITGVTVAPASKVVSKGGTAQLTASVLPAGSTQTVTWDSNKTPAVRVSATGLVTVSADAVLGTVATITATSTVDTTKKGTSTITVGTPVTGVSVAPTSATISAGGTVQLTATLVPANPTISTVTWSSSNTSVATVNGSGLTATVTGVAAGSATITCTTTDGGFPAGSSITVSGGPTPPPAPEPGPIPVPVPIPDLPGAIEKPDVGMPSSTSGLPGGYPDLVSSYGGRLVLKSSVIDSISRSIEAASGVSLPVFTGSVSAAGKSAAFAFELDESGLVGQPVSSLRLVKVKSASSHLEFSRVSKISDLADGKFVIVTSAGVIREANDTVRSTDVLVLVIKDNGAFDMDRTPAVILDPCFLAQSTRRGGGGGGCTAGAFAPMALLLAAPLLLLLKK